MRDPHFGHRDWFTGEIQEGSTEWTDWDYALVSAYQIVQDNTGSDGVLAWENEAENIQVEAIRKTNKFEQARQVYTGRKNYKAAKGEVFVPRVKLLYDDYPTYSAWVQGQVESEE